MDATAKTKLIYADASQGVMSLDLLERLGDGRAAQVYLVSDRRDSTLYAEKVFKARGGLSKLARELVYMACFQAPFPYRTRGSAVRAALFRRKVLHELTRFWFGKPLIADAYYTRWDEKAKTYVLGTEYIGGHGPKLGQVNHHLLRSLLYNYSIRLYKKLFAREQSRKLEGPPWEIDEAVAFLDKLKAKFRQAGFLGSEWQVDKTLSVPTSNLLRNGSNEWMLVDVESALPALAHPGYIWRAIKCGSFPLFDDVDFTILRKYLADNHQGLLISLGKLDTERLYYYANQLEHHTKVWKASEPAIFSHRQDIITDPQLRNNIRWGFVEHWYKSGQITTERAIKIQDSDLLFIRYLGFALLKDILLAFGTFTSSLKNMVRKVSKAIAKSLRMVYSAFFDESYLRSVSKLYVLENIDSWQKSERLTKSEADKLREDVESPVAEEYIQGFVAHMGLQLIEPPFIGNAALISLAIFLGCPELLGALFISPILRTIYTLYRRIKNRGKGIAYHYAFLVGALPKVGALAYCTQMYSTYPDLSTFLTRFYAAGVGRCFPLLGAENARFEHFCVKSVDLLASLQYEFANLTSRLKSILRAVWHQGAHIASGEAGTISDDH
ncbi:hypothetical protein ACFLT3_01035 [Chloroflexota bacterium]